MFSEPKMGPSDSSFVPVDRMAPEVKEALDAAPVFKKQGSVRARQAEAGEVVVTMLKNGQEETRNAANEGDFIVTNPDGEEYIVPGKKFNARYEVGAEDGVYLAKGFVRAATNPFGKPIEIMASWGEAQRGDERCLFADVCDEKGNRDGSPYIIAADEFARTYKQVED